MCSCSVCDLSHALEVGSLDLLLSQDGSLFSFSNTPFKGVIAIACAWMLISAHL